MIGAYYALLNTTESGKLFPTPDFYLLKIWQMALSGKLAVLHAETSPNTLRTTRVYSFCGAGQLGIVAINLNATHATCLGPPVAADKMGSMSVWTLTPAGGVGVTAPGASLNGGEELGLTADGSLPPLLPSQIPVAQGLQLPPMSVTISLLPLAQGAAPACAK